MGSSVSWTIRGYIVLHSFMEVNCQQDFTIGIWCWVYNVLGLSWWMYINGLMISRSNFQFSNLRLFPRVERGAFSESIEILFIFWRCLEGCYEEKMKRRQKEEVLLWNLGWCCLRGVRLSPSDTGTIVPIWHGTDVIVSKWDWVDCS